MIRDQLRSAAFKIALLDYCDWQLSRAYGFKDSQAKKTDPKVKYAYFIQQWIAICPFELLALQAVYLDADHPLLRTLLMSPPTFDGLATDALLDQVTEAAWREFGERWQPEALVPLPDKDGLSAQMGAKLPRTEVAPSFLTDKSAPDACPDGDQCFGAGTNRPLSSYIILI